MKLIRSFLMLSTVAAMTGLMAAPSLADSGRHPHYLHALADLRMARALLEETDRRNVMEDQQEAIYQIDAAVSQIKRAEIDDGKDLHDHPAIDANLDRPGRLHQAIVLVREANEDLHSVEDDRAALEWRKSAIHYVDEATKKIDRAMQDQNKDQQKR
jgi:hypothetical protein